MNSSPAGEITIQLERWRDGDPTALTTLTPLVYNQLRNLARAYLRGAAPLQATELVNEMFVQLLRSRRVEFNDRQHFFAFAARLMRQTLIHEARRADSDKRGSGRTLFPLDAELAWVPTPTRASSVDLASALSQLEALDDLCVRIIELRYFFGFTAEETAELLSLSKATIDRNVRFGLTWLHSRLHPDSPL